MIRQGMHLRLMSAALAVVMLVVLGWAMGAGPGAGGEAEAAVAARVGSVEAAPVRAHVGGDEFGESYWDDEFWDDEYWDDGDYWDDGYWEDDEYGDDDYRGEGFWDDYWDDGYWDDGFDDGFFEDDFEDFDDAFFEDDFGDFEDGFDGGFGGGFEDEGETLATFDVVGGALGAPRSSGQISASELVLYQGIWDRFTTLIPAAQREMVARFEIFTDGRDGILAAVEPLANDATRWTLSVDVADISDPRELDHTLIHEFAHLLTLNTTQVPALPGDAGPFAFDQAAATCGTYFPGEGCSNPASYINLFVDAFWTDLLPRVQAIEAIADDDAYYEALDALAVQVADQFVSDYAVTNPGEDLAETFAIFVLDDRPLGSSVADQKIEFLYGFPELVTLRDAIRAGL